MRPSRIAAESCSVLPLASRRRAQVMHHVFLVTIQRLVCWYTVCQGRRSLGIIRHGAPIRTIQRKPLNTSRKLCSRCGASSFANIRQGATNAHFSSVTSLGDVFLVSPRTSFRVWFALARTEVVVHLDRIATKRSTTVGSKCVPARDWIYSMTASWVQAGR